LDVAGHCWVVCVVCAERERVGVLELE
jgi:hypothetical protein